MIEKKIRVVIADDSALMRREIRRILESEPCIEVVEAARNGLEAVEATRRHEPDVVALDINMPVMDGLTALQYIMMESPRPVVMISSLTQEGALTSYEALELGAVDFVPKPGGTISLDLHKSAQQIVYKVLCAANAKPGLLGRGRGARRAGAGRAEKRPAAPQADTGKVVVIGQSTGGPSTIMDILPLLPADFPAPVIVVQHMPSAFTPSFAQRLDQHCAFPFKEAERGDVLEGGHGLLAPGDIHLALSRRGPGQTGFMVRLTHTPANALHQPSVDVAMDSVLEHFGANTIGVLLTGMGDDGARAMVNIRKAGGRTVAESEETAIVFGMPREAILRGGAEFVLPSHRIAEKITELVQA